MNTNFVLIIFNVLYLDQFVGSFWTAYPDQQRWLRIKERHQRYQALSIEEKNNLDKVRSVCGDVEPKKGCTKLVGRYKDEEVENCDRYCCSLGYLTGYCDVEVDINVDLTTKAEGFLLGNREFNLVANCACSDDWHNAYCGKLGLFLGISCPFDESACARKCCHQDKSNFKCGGLFGAQCQCSGSLSVP